MGNNYFFVYELEGSAFCKGFEGIFGDSVLNAMIGNNQASSTLFQSLRKVF